MKVLLINPTGGPEAEYGMLAQAATELPQLGLASVAAALAENGHAVKILDYHQELLTAEQLLSRIDQGRFDLVGFSVYVTTIKKTLELAARIKARFPAVHICAGGPQVTLTPDRFQNESIDYIFVGEADHSIIELTKALESGLRPDGIQGLLYRSAGGFSGDRELRLEPDLDALPPLRLDEFYDLSQYYPPVHVRGRKVINVVSVRGCPYGCTFCAAAAINGRKLRKMSPTRFVDLLEYYVGRGFDSFMVYDDTFTIDKKRAVEISEGILRRKLKISWNCWSRADCVDHDTLSIMKKAGCYYLMFGFESLNEKTLRRLKKGFSVEDCLRAVEISKKAGLLVSSSFMIGVPGETREDILHTIDLVNKTHLDVAIFPLFEPYAGTPIFEDAQREGRWEKCEEKNNLLIEQEEVWVPNGFTRKELVKMAHAAFRSFYFRPYAAVSMARLLWALPLSRQIRFLRSGLDYFFLRPLA